MEARIPRACWALVVAATLLTAVDLGAQSRRFQGAAHLLRLEGFVGTAPAGARPEAHLILQYKGKDYDFDLTKMIILSGDVSYGQVLQSVKPYRVSFFLRGSSPAVDVLTKAELGRKLVLQGYHRMGSRDLMIVEAEETPSDPRPTPS